MLTIQSTSGRNYVITRRGIKGVHAAARPIFEATGIYQIALADNYYSLIAGYHEVGHFETGQTGALAQAERAYQAIMGGPSDLALAMEAAAWRWAVKAWAARGRKLGAREKAFIRYAYGTYCSAHQVRFHAGRKGLRSHLLPGSWTRHTKGGSDGRT